MLLRIAALVLTCLSVACVNTPDGPRSALGLNETSILEASPGSILLAIQSNYGLNHAKPNPLTLILRSETDAEIFNELLDTQVVKVGGDVGHGLPLARKNQVWRLLALDKQGIDELERAQQIYRQMKAADQKGSMSLQVEWARGDGLSTRDIPETIYLTAAIRLSPEDPWLTMMDNYPVYPEKSQNADTHTDGTEATP